MSRIICAVEGNSTAAPPLTHLPRTKRGVHRMRPVTSANDSALVAFTPVRDTVRRLALPPLPLLAFTA